MQRLSEGVAALAEAKESGSDITERDSIDQRALTAGTTTDMIDLKRLRELPVRIHAEVTGDGCAITFDAAPRGAVVLKPDGDIARLVADEQVEAFQDAVQTGDAAKVLAALGQHHIALQLTVENDAEASGFHWVPAESVIAAALAGESWLATLRLLFTHGRAETVVVADAGDAWLSAAALTVRGPDATAAPMPEQKLPDGLPTPGDLVVGDKGHGLATVRAALVPMPALTAWHALADEVEGTAPPTVRYTGQRVASVDLVPGIVGAGTDEIALWEWATETDDYLRKTSVSEAIALAIFGPADVERAAAPALRTAKTLYKNASSGAVGEALAARRSARESGFAAARAAAEAARTASAKTLERVLAQAVAAAGVLIAQATKAISQGATLRLLALIGVLLVATLVVALVVDYPSARSTVDRFKKDLELYEDALSSSDIEKIAEMGVLKDAQSRIRTSLVLSVVIVAVALVLLAVAVIRIS